MAATKPRDLTPAGTWVGTTLSNLWLWAGRAGAPAGSCRLLRPNASTARTTAVQRLSSVEINSISCNQIRYAVFVCQSYLLHNILFFVCTVAVFFFYCDLCSLCILLFAAIWHVK